MQKTAHRAATHLLWVARPSADRTPGESGGRRESRQGSLGVSVSPGESMHRSLAVPGSPGESRQRSLGVQGSPGEYYLGVQGSVQGSLGVAGSPPAEVTFHSRSLRGACISYLLSKGRSQNNRSEPDAKIQKWARSKKSQSEPDAQIQKRSNDNRSQKIQKRSEGLKNRDPSYSGTSKEYRKPPKWSRWPCSFQNASKPGTIRKTPADSTASVQCFLWKEKAH